MVLTGLLVFTACENDPEEVKTVTANRNVPVEVAEDVELKYSEYGIAKVNVKATKLKRYGGENPYLEVRDGVELLFFDSAQNVTSRLTAKNALHKINQQIMEVRDSVVVINEEGEKIETEELIWNEKEEKISSDKFVKITTPDEILMGEGFEANQDFTRYKIKKVKATLKVKEEDEQTENKEDEPGK